MTNQEQIERLSILIENWSLKINLAQRDIQKLREEEKPEEEKVKPLTKAKAN